MDGWIALRCDDGGNVEGRFKGLGFLLWVFRNDEELYKAESSVSVKFSGLIQKFSLRSKKKTNILMAAFLWPQNRAHEALYIFVWGAHIRTIQCLILRPSRSTSKFRCDFDSENLLLAWVGIWIFLVSPFSGEREPVRGRSPIVRGESVGPGIVAVYVGT